MSSSDQLQRVIFEQADIRSVITGLEKSYQQAINNHQYPALINRFLGEMMAAVSLLSSTLKFEGRLMLQAQSNNQVKVLMAECNHQCDLRAIARFDGELPDSANFCELLKGGQLVITIEPDKGQRYQGVVPLEGDHLSSCLEAYFSRSEQLPTQIQLVADEQRAAGFLLQVMPAKGNAEDEWQHFSYLAATLKDEELLELDNATIIRRLFHEEDCRLYDAEPLQFKCDCSRKRTGDALRYMTQKELEEIVRDEGTIDVSCQFCNQLYQFDQADITMMFSDSANIEGSDQVH
ncbi:Hsp33 family molecular chaperone HslO [Amphritea balenae]|uniref:33 kDa chaperonin n=1 Tax=Amphritea balenae TaxID=452629 RepID=A0A3P1SJG3_9GAMM|nr:Hsp33 family molecular chaperone HslO [Amphritea balenae]RRC97431.1 Hsp33 family molecular chaperone HslO [Amphritea balenae]GGK84367.1 33 kDa chaperonin [Amphritea balenae]